MLTANMYCAYYITLLQHILLLKQNGSIYYNPPEDKSLTDTTISPLDDWSWYCRTV